MSSRNNRNAPATMSGRGSRNSTGSRPSRGGIQKRRGGSLGRGQVRVDIDGDLTMDASSISRNSKRRARGVSLQASHVASRHYNGDTSGLAARVATGPSVRPRHEGPATAYKYLRIYGLHQSKAAGNKSGGLLELVSFLERKAKRRTGAIKKCRIHGDFVYIGVKPDDAQELLRLNKFFFAGAELQVAESMDGFGPGTTEGMAITVPESTHTQEVRLALRQVLSQRYTSTNKLLNLDRLSSDAALSQLGMFRTKDAAQKTFQVLMVICDGLFKTAKEKRDAVESITLADNGIDDVSQVEALVTTFPDLKHLDMSRNLIKGMLGLHRWKGRFHHLETIFLSGNPVENEPAILTKLLEWFPTVQNINGTLVRTAAEVAQALAIARPTPMPQHGPDFRDYNGIAEGFLLDFFPHFDNDRMELLSRLYDETSQFSLAVGTSSVRDVTAPPPITWAPYIKFSRNFLKVTHPATRVQRLFCGVRNIGDLWSTFPMTRHPDIKQELNKFIMDCHILPGLVDPLAKSAKGVDGMVISVHGEYEELNPVTQKSGKRSFSRSFVLGPGQPGRNPIRVVSDMLSLRAFNALPNVFSAPTASTEIPTLITADKAVVTQSGEPTHLQSLIAELSKQTGMTAIYSSLCLTEVGWDIARGMVVFHQKKAELPPDAFLRVGSEAEFPVNGM